MVLVVTDDTNSARDVISIFMITIYYVNNKPQSVNNRTLKSGSGLEYVYNIFSTKGQLISKYPFGFIVLTKKPPNFFKDFCPSLKKRLDKK